MTLEATQKYTTLPLHKNKSKKTPKLKPPLVQPFAKVVSVSHF